MKNVDVVSDFFKNNSSGTLNDVLSFFESKNGEVTKSERAKKRHALYQVIKRRVEKGLLLEQPTSGNQLRYCAVAEQQLNESTISKLQDRLKNLEYELSVCISEANDYTELSNLVPNLTKLLEDNKQAAKKRAIELNGKLISTRKVLKAVQASR